MAHLRPPMKPLALFRPIVIPKPHTRQPFRSLTTSLTRPGILGLDIVPPRRTGEKTAKIFSQEFPRRYRPRFKKALKKFKVYPSPLSTRRHCREPLAAVTATQISSLDPTGARTRLFAVTNPEAAKVGDILLVRQKNGDPFAGVCLNIRRRGVETAILLRNQITRVGVEMWYKIYSPNVVGIEVVQRRIKRARRARLYYMRKPEHDMGSVQNIVTQYIRQRQVLRSGGDAKGRDANSHKKKEKKKK